MRYFYITIFLGCPRNIFLKNLEVVLKKAQAAEKNLLQMYKPKPAAVASAKPRKDSGLPPSNQS
jgi:hypothetical protein